VKHEKRTLKKNFVFWPLCFKSANNILKKHKVPHLF
jgi:hypothetical protein